MRLSLAALNVSGAPRYLRDALTALAQTSCRAIINASNPPAITDNSTGVAASGIAPVAVLGRVTPSGANLSPRSNFNTAIGVVDNAISVLAKYLSDNDFTKVFTDGNGPTITLNATGTIATPGTIPAMTKSLSATDGANSGNAQATGTLTNDGTNITDGDTVTIAGKVYTFQDTLTNVDGHVLKGASNTASMTNLFHAINASGGTPGTDYAALTTAHPSVVATNPTGTTVVVTAKSGGLDGNSITTVENSTHLSWGAGTLAGGTASVNGNAMKRSEAMTALGRMTDNLATVIKAYNTMAVALGVATLADTSGGKADPSYKLYDKLTATTSVDGSALTAVSDVAGDTVVDAALNALANNVATVAAKITNVLHATATKTTPVPVILTP